MSETIPANAFQKLSEAMMTLGRAVTVSASTLETAPRGEGFVVLSVAMAKTMAETLRNVGTVCDELSMALERDGEAFCRDLPLVRFPGMEAK